MAIISIGHKPDLSIDEAREIFARGMAGRYEIMTSEVRSRHFIVQKDGWRGVGVKLQQREGETRFVFTGMISNFWLQFFFGGMFSYPLLRGSWKSMEAEVAEYIASESAFSQTPDADEELKAA
jgi:hypothetical protein